MPYFNSFVILIESISSPRGIGEGESFMQSARSINDYVLWFTIFLDNTAYSLYGAIFSVYLYDLGASFSQIALLSALPSIVVLLLARFWGIVSDETGIRKGFIIWNKYFSALFVFLYGLTKDVNKLIILFVLATIIGSPGGPALNALITIEREKGRRGRRIGTFISSSTLGYAFGSFFSANILFFLRDIKYVFMISSAILLFSALIFTILYKEQPHRALTRTLIISSLLKAYSLREFYLDRAIIPLLLGMTIFNIGTAAFFQIFIFKYYIVIGKNMALYALVSSIMSVFSAIAPPLYGYIGDKIGLGRFLLVMMSVRILYMVALVLVWDPLALTILWILPIWAGIYLSSIALATEILGDEKAARAQGTFAISRSVSNIVGSIVSGILADYVGARKDITKATPIYAGSILTCVSALMIMGIGIGWGKKVGKETMPTTPRPETQ